MLITSWHADGTLAKRFDQAKSSVRNIGVSLVVQRQPFSGLVVFRIGRFQVWPLRPGVGLISENDANPDFVKPVASTDRSKSSLNSEYPGGGSCRGR